MLVCSQTRKIKTKGNIINLRNWDRVRPNNLLVHDNLLSGVVLFNPLNPNIHIQILQTDLYTFPLRIS